MSSGLKLNVSTKFPLPTALETRAVGRNPSQTALAYLKVDGLKVKYIGPGDEDSQAASIRSNHAIPLDCPLFFFEVEILNRGVEGFIGVGLQTEDVSLTHLPGWGNHSYAYHGDDGHVFNAGGSGRPWGPTFTTGDVIGILYNRSERTISFLKNSVDLGVAFQGVLEERLFPVVGLRTRDEEVVINFGATPFKTDLASLQADLTNKTLASIQRMQVPLLSSLGTGLLPHLVFDYLVHHRCSGTAQVIARDLLPKSVGLAEASMADMSNRQAIFEAVLGGKTDTALQLVQSGYPPQVLDEHPRVRFKLRCQKFIEMVAVGDSEGALAYGRSVLAPLPEVAEDEELLKDALSLLAYTDPGSSPCGYLMQRRHREKLAEELNGALLQAQGLSRASALERIFQQTVTAVDELRRTGDVNAQLLDVQKLAFQEAQDND